MGRVIGGSGVEEKAVESSLKRGCDDVEGESTDEEDNNHHFNTKNIILGANCTTVGTQTHLK